MDIDLAEIEQSLVMIYQKNLQFLKENFFDIFEEVDQFSKDLEAGRIKEKYSLEMKNGYFDIQNLENAGYYYATNSYVDAEKRAEHVDFTAKSSLDLLRRDGSSHKLSMPYGLEEVLPVVGFINEKVDMVNVEFQKIMKFIYIGVGLGYHIQEMEKKLESYTTLIIEPELEIFRLSLFTMDYSIFEKENRTLFLSVGDDSPKREKVIGNFYHCHSYMNYNIKYYSLLKNLDYIKSELIEYCERHFAGAFPYASVIDNVHRTVQFIRDKDRFLVINGVKERAIFGNKEILLVSAGPSLDDYIELIEKYQDKYIVACVDVIVRKLEKNHIVPDIIFSIDPSPRCAEFLTTDDPKYLKDSVIVLLSQQHPEMMNVLRERNLHYYISQFTTINKEIGCLGSVPNVGTFAFHVMAHLGGKKLFTIGNDASFHQETGARYTEDSSHSQTEVLDMEEKDESMISKEDILEVKGNLRDIVRTNRSLITFRNDYDMVIDNLKSYEKYEAYNLSDGIYIEGIVPMKKDEFISLSEEIQSSDIDLQNIFNGISKVLKADCYEKDIRIITSIIQRAKKFQKQKIVSRDDLLAKKLDFMIWILEKSKELSIVVFGNIFLEYTNLVDSYINFTINLKQKDLYSQENLSLLQSYWAKGVMNVFKDMKKAIS